MNRSSLYFSGPNIRCSTLLRRAHVWLFGLAVTSVALAGCSTTTNSNRLSQNRSVSQPADPAYIGHAGNSWEAVLPGPIAQQTTQRLAQNDGAWILSRADASLSPRDPAVPMATNWPSAPRPSLYRPRTIRVFRTSDSFIFYRAERTRSSNTSDRRY